MYATVAISPNLSGSFGLPGDKIVLESPSVNFVVVAFNEGDSFEWGELIRDDDVDDKFLGGELVNDIGLNAFAEGARNERRKTDFIIIV